MCGFFWRPKNIKEIMHMLLQTEMFYDSFINGSKSNTTLQGEGGEHAMFCTSSVKIYWE